MQYERLDADRRSRRRWRPQLRALVPAPESVARRGRRDHRRACAPAATTRCATTPAEFDTGGTEPRGAAGHRGRARHRAEPRSTRRVRARAATWRSRTSTAVAEARTAPPSRPWPFDGPRGPAPRGPGRHAPASTCPAAARPYPSTVVMGAVTARVAGVAEHRRVLAARAPTATSTPVVLGACRLAGATVVYRMGGAQAIAALAYGTETVAAGRRDRRPGQPVRPGGQAPGVRPGRRSTASPARATCMVIADRRRRPGAARARPAGPGRARRRARWWSRSPTPPSCSTRSPSGSADEPDTERGGAPGRASPTPSRRWRSPRRSRPSTCSSSAPRPRRSRRRVTPRRLRVRRRRPAAPRSATTSPAPTTCCRPTARRGSPRRCRPTTSGAASPRCGSATTPPRWPRPAAPIARAEGFELHARSMEARIRDNGDAMTRAAEIDRKTGRDRDPAVSLALDGDGAGERDTGVGFFDHMLDLLARHGRLDLTVRGARRPRDRRPPHRRGRRDLHRPGARPGARRPRRDRPLRPGHDPDGRGPGVVRDRHLRPRAAARSRRTLPPGAIGNFDHELAEEFFRALARQRQADAAPHGRGAGPTPTT